MKGFRLDPLVAFHWKVHAAKNEAFGAWCRAGAWCMAYKRDGHVPEDTALDIAPLRVWQRLEKVRLVERVDDGWQIHDFADWNPAEGEEMQRHHAPAETSAARREAGRAGGQARAEKVRQEASKNSPDDQAKLDDEQGLGKQNPTFASSKTQAKLGGQQVLLGENSIATLQPDLKISPDPEQEPPYNPPSGDPQAKLKQNSAADEFSASKTHTAPKQNSRRSQRQRVIPGTEPPVEAVLEHWASQPFHGCRPKFTPARYERVRARLAEGFTVDELKAALDGANLDDWLMGREDRSKKVFKDLETHLRDAAQVERLRDLAHATQPSREPRKRTTDPPPPPPDPEMMAVDVPAGAALEDLFDAVGRRPTPEARRDVLL